jgi:hypothetical protein
MMMGANLANCIANCVASPRCLLSSEDGPETKIRHVKPLEVGGDLVAGIRVTDAFFETETALQHKMFKHQLSSSISQRIVQFPYT